MNEQINECSLLKNYCWNLQKNIFKTPRTFKPWENIQQESKNLKLVITQWALYKGPCLFFQRLGAEHEARISSKI